MAHDYRYNAFNDVAEPLAIRGEMHIIPFSSPYTIRLLEVPQKTTPSSITLTIAGTAASEVAATPAAGEFWPDYSTGADGDNGWNTGTILFNAADAGKTVVVSYNGMGSLASVDFHGSQLFTANGTFTVPKGVDTVYITGCGGGGGGGGAYNLDYPVSGGGGGGGACAYKTPLTVASGQSYTITIGAGGAKSAKNTRNGSSGGVTSFGVLLSLSGGGGGAYNGDGGTAGNALASAGGDGGHGDGGGGGNSASFACGSVGGGSLFGAGGAMRGSKSGSGYGAGGAGGAETTSDGIGGNGTQGFILVEW